jgi:hypothetical protein
MGNARVNGICVQKGLAGEAVVAMHNELGGKAVSSLRG